MKFKKWARAAMLAAVPAAVAAGAFAQSSGDVTGSVDARIVSFISALRAEIDARFASLPSGGAAAEVASTVFGGRLTLQPGSAIITQDQIGARKLYYAPLGTGGMLPVKIAGSWRSRSFIASAGDQNGLTLDLAGSSAWAPGSLHDVFAVVDGSNAVRLATREWDSGMMPTEAAITGGTVMTAVTGSTQWLRPASAFDGVVPKTWENSARLYPANTDDRSSLVNCIGRDWAAPKTVTKIVVTAASNNMLQNTGSSALMAKSIASDDGVNWIDLGFYYLDSSASGARYEIPVNEAMQTPYRMHEFCVAGSANASINIADLQFIERLPALSRRLAMDGGFLVNDAPMTVRTSADDIAIVPAGQVFLGVIHIDDDAPGQVTAHVSYGPNRTYGVWNAQNQRPIGLRAAVPRPNSSDYVLTANRWQLVSPGFSLQILQGLAQDLVPVVLDRGFFINAAAGPKGYEAGIAIDNTSVFSGTQIGGTIDSRGTQVGFFQAARHSIAPFAGIKRVNAIERVNFGAGVASPFVGARSTVLTADWRG